MNNRATIYDDEAMRMVLEFYGAQVYVHLRVHRWSASVLRLMRARWPQVKALLGSVGYNAIRAFAKESNANICRFASLFGFAELHRRDGWIVMEARDA